MGIVAIFLFVGNLTFGQTFKLNSKAGLILLNSNYVNIQPYGIQRVEAKNINPPQIDIYAWKWIGRTFEYHFEVYPPEMFLVKRSLKTGNIIETIKILKYDIKK